MAHNVLSEHRGLRAIGKRINPSSPILSLLADTAVRIYLGIAHGALLVNRIHRHLDEPDPMYLYQN